MFPAPTFILEELAETTFIVLAVLERPAPAVTEACTSAKVVPSFVSCQASVVSFHLIETLSLDPLSTSITPFSDGTPDAVELMTILLSSTINVVVLTVIIFPVTERLPPTLRLFVMLALFAVTFADMVADPETAREDKVPTDVRLEFKTVDLSVVPVKVFALAEAIVVPVTVRFPVRARFPAITVLPSTLTEATTVLDEFLNSTKLAVAPEAA